LSSPSKMPPASGAMKRSEIEAWAAEAEEPLMLADGLDDAIVGVVQQNDGSAAVLYDSLLCLRVLATAHPEWSPMEVAEWFETEVAGTLGTGYPAFVVFRVARVAPSGD